MSDAFSAVLTETARLPLSLSIARKLQQAIVSGALEDGTPLPSEKELCERLSVGRSTVREALRILQAQGLVTGGDRVSTRGPRVHRGGALPTAASALSTAVLLARLPCDDLVELRLLIEAEAVRRAAELRDEDALGRARAALDVMLDCQTDPEAFLQADVAFHTALVEASGNRAYGLVMAVVREAMATHLRDALTVATPLDETLQTLGREHATLLDAIAAGDANRAEALVCAHISGFYWGAPSQ
ncbi:FadR/GntR family transcriptional regulator [Enhygromyxa salina]|uniref:HTH-type transcriptional regulator LutR n=1 Tax=Enhygromyxa salina TaxID=215803 RepID=A0A2S9YVH9_9BACT|nr:FadR/GntR family transcriptional regulator [Enhygromyxa salina]PRQ09093.1 HTH-type transcriptional regulator LutR [Enhygromyxa salina]